MLANTRNLYRTAINRVTFGSRDVDAQIVVNIGWATWVNDQLKAPKGDDPDLAAFMAQQVMNIQYGASDPKNTSGSWPAVNEDRTLNYLSSTVPDLWKIARGAGNTVASQERTRITQEITAASWVRNTHSHYQLREFMVDFWHNHFNIGKNENALATALLGVYDRDVIRPNAFGNFRTLLEGIATSGSMLIYLDNWVSTATTPNENYAREIMELHTLGAAVYYGKTTPTDVANAMGAHGGFSDQDVVQASRALSGWTLKYGQRQDSKTNFVDTGEFVFSAYQHNNNATQILGYNMTNKLGMTQGQGFLDVIAYHPATASFVVTKLAKRMFGDTPPKAAIARGVAAWTKAQQAPDQIAQVLRAILLEGNEALTEPPTKVRRPYERIIALFRTTDMVVSASTIMLNALDTLNDGLFAWPAPDGRPDVNDYWLATGANMQTWNLLLQVPQWAQVKTSLAAQVPPVAQLSASAVVEYWVERMIGYTLAGNGINALVTDQAGSNGVPAMVRGGNATRIEQAHRRLVSLIATTEEFTLR